MGSEWDKALLLDHYEVRSGLSKPAKDFGSGFPFVSFKDVFYNFFLPLELEQLVQSSEKERANCSVERGDVFLTRTSETMNELGMSSVALKDYEGATFNGFSKRLRPKPDCPIFPEFIGYYLRSPQFRQEMLSFSTMSTRASLNNEMIGKLTIPIPPMDEQQSIAFTLKKLDDKIQLNRQTNQTLEQMAQALFKSWFVDFDPVIDNALAAGNPIPPALQKRAAIRAEQLKQQRDKRLSDSTAAAALANNPEQLRALFPSEFEHTEELGWVPKGWGVGTVDNVVTRLKAGKRYTKKEVQGKGRIPVFEQGQDILLGYHNHEPNFLATPEDPVFIFGDHTCVTKLGIEPFSISANVIPLKGKVRNTYWTYYAVRDLQKFEEYRRHWMEFAIKPLVIPTEGTANLFSDFVSILTKKACKLERESSGLSQIRDTLLPKLISGELRLPDTETTAAALTE